MKLEPCRFCGGEAEFEQIGTRKQSCIVVCTGCGCRLGSLDEDDDSGSSWNCCMLPERRPAAIAWRRGPYCGITPEVSVGDQFLAATRNMDDSWSYDVIWVESENQVRDLAGDRWEWGGCDVEWYIPLVELTPPDGHPGAGEGGGA